MAAKKFTKSALAVGDYESPDRKVPVTPERLKHWQAEHQRMQANGYEVPIGWDHAATLDKISPIKKRSAKDTVGFLDKIELAADGKSVEFHMDVSDKRGQEQAEANRVYVSPVILDEWKDGGGNVYKDVISHVDFVNHPVDFSQGPFKELPAVEPGFVACAIRMGLSAPIRMGEFPPADDDQADKTDDSEKKPDADPPEEANPDLPKEEPDNQQMEALLAHMAQAGYPLPSDTDESNLVERMLVAFMVANNAKNKAKEEEDSANNDTNDQGEPVVKEPGYAVMSADAKAAHAYAQNLHQKGIHVDLAGLLKSGRCTPHEHAERSKVLGAVRLSLDTEGKPAVSDLEKWIDSRQPLPAGTFFDTATRTRMSAEAIDPPDIVKETTHEEAEALARRAHGGKR